MHVWFVLNEICRFLRYRGMIDNAVASHGSQYDVIRNWEAPNK